MPEKLKKGWTRVAFGDVVQLSRERTSDPAQAGFDRYVGLEHLDPGDLKIRRWGNVSDGTTFTSVFHAEQVLFGKRRSYQRKLAVPDFDGVCSGDIYVFKPKNDHLLPELLPFICKTDGFFDHAVGTSAGSLSPRTNWESLAGFEFALPPLDEQERICSVMSTCTQAIYALEAVANSAEAARLAYFKAMISNSNLDAIELRNLVVQGGMVRGPFGGSLKKEIFVEKGYMVYEQSHAIAGDLNRGRYFIDEIKYKEMERFHLIEGDLIMSCSGTIGKVAVVADGAPEGVINQALLKIRPNQKRVNSYYLANFIRSADFQEAIARLSIGSAMSNVASVRLIERVKVPLPIIEVQNEIVNVLMKMGNAVELGRQRKDIIKNFSATVMDTAIGEVR